MVLEDKAEEIRVTPYPGTPSLEQLHMQKHPVQKKFSLLKDLSDSNNCV